MRHLLRMLLLLKLGGSRRISYHSETNSQSQTVSTAQLLLKRLQHKLLVRQCLSQAASSTSASTAASTTNCCWLYKCEQYGGVSTTASVTSASSETPGTKNGIWSTRCGRSSRSFYNECFQGGARSVCCEVQPVVTAKLLRSKSYTSCPLVVPMIQAWLVMM